ncbi:hypothetical protein RISK_003802 [Rhodopirellula islandica]|uniref:Uncharacterized protein n=1 Tax=Rhodopirellula islandica TaxID=595434 RepID=A0A0J1BCI4_RHOIS|nr:hypothetical protein RISK_003802 [Rhodopirellula islandica]
MDEWFRPKRTLSFNDARVSKPGFASGCLVPEYRRAEFAGKEAGR